MRQQLQVCVDMLLVKAGISAFKTPSQFKWHNYLPMQVWIVRVLQ